MPIYAYKCESCGHRQDVLQKVSDPLLDACPACGAARFVKQVTAAGFQLKGSGWYATDFRGGAAPKPDDGETKPDAKPEAKADAKADGNSDAKADTKTQPKPSAAAAAPAAAPAAEKSRPPRPEAA